MYISKRKQRAEALSAPSAQAESQIVVRNIEADGVLDAELISDAEEQIAVPLDASEDNQGAEESTALPPPFSEPTVSNSEITYGEFLKNNTETGTLRVQAFIGNQGMPVGDATVIVFSEFSDGERIFYTVKTDSDGIADDLILPAPKRESSELPGSTNPYAEYSITVSHPDYLTQRYEKVPIFAGVRSIQPVAFLPSLNGG